ncbi:ABC transporter ATP-binding protein [Pseudonocardia alni]|uniref:ABC transporter ATP-binding protein n=1 Tax=Pseudonocardia alni TaxID=33907 RepID=UPI0034025831
MPEPTTRDHGVGLELSGLTKRYGAATVLDGVDLSVAPGEFMTLLGPSGSGKTTTLNMIAGFVEPDAGQIHMGDTPLVGLPAHKRDIGVVFQHYALFPHMRVDANVAFPLRQRRVPKAEAARTVSEMLDVVGLGHLARRYPRELSGGQQQRVALARALVFRPRLLLLDEPLGALDKRLRETLQMEIKRIHREVGVTFVFVTHDQEEALVLSDRIAVFNEGRIEQVGTAQDLYERPRTLFAAEFLGDSNVLRGRVRSADGGVVELDCDGLAVTAPGTAAVGGTAAVVLRPERVTVLDADAQPPAGHNHLDGIVDDVVYLGGRRRLLVGCPGRTMLVDEMAPRRGLTPGEPVRLCWAAVAGTVVAGDPAPATPEPTRAVAV